MLVTVAGGRKKGECRFGSKVSPRTMKRRRLCVFWRWLSGSPKLAANGQILMATRRMKTIQHFGDYYILT
jgi:hypothetical protein